MGTHTPDRRMTAARFLVGDVFDVLATLEPGSVDLVMSSPPFLALRSYLPADHPDKGREIGSEATPADFLDTLLDVVEACDRVLARHGSLVFELGDTYAGSGGAGGDYGDGGLRHGQDKFGGSALADRKNKVLVDGKRLQQGTGWPLDKSLCGIPTLFAWSLAYGRNLLRPERTTPPWRIRNIVAWARPNPPVSALGDKFRPATSYLTVATKARDRYFDLDAVRSHPDEVKDKRVRTTNGPKNHADPSEVLTANYTHRVPSNPAGAPPLDYWVIPTQPYSESHFATYPERLCETPIKAMCPLRVCTTCGQPSRRIAETIRLADKNDAQRKTPASNHRLNAHKYPPKVGWEMAHNTLGWTDCGHNTWRTGIVLDPFAGSGTTLAVATGHGRNAIGIDIDGRNADLALGRVGPLMLTVEHISSEGAA
jgi:site-specific DNA-methyltransferase (cytosine-N4-specific)